MDNLAQIDRTGQLPVDARKQMNDALYRGEKMNFPQRNEHIFQLNAERATVGRSTMGEASDLAELTAEYHIERVAMNTLPSGLGEK